MNIIDFSQETEDDIVANYTPREVTYALNGAPVAVKVIDPLNVQPGNYKLLLNEATTPAFNIGKKNMLDTCDWMLLREYGNNIDTIISNMSIQVGNEQLIPEWGISVDIEYYQYAQEGDGPRPDFLAVSYTHLTLPTTPYV